MKVFHRRYTAPGAPPGSSASGPVSFEPTVHVLSYSPDQLEELTSAGVEEALARVAPGRVTWIDVRGLGDGTIVRALSTALGLHPLAVSDVVNLGQRPKVESYDGELFLIVRMVTIGPEGSDEAGELQWEQVSVFFTPDAVVTFQETPRDCLDGLRERIRSARPKIRSSGTDYLACMVIDSIVDGYFPVLEHYGDRLERLEEEVFESGDDGILQVLYRTRRDLTGFRRAVWPLREALVQLNRDPEAPLGDDVRLHMRDVIDHTLQVSEVNDSYGDLVSNLVEMHLSLTAHHTNDVMRVLTLVAAIFIPLSFIAGVYGMNFDTAAPANLPELGWPFGYVYFWSVCLTIAGFLLIMFYRLGWLRRPR